MEKLNLRKRVVTLALIFIITVVSIVPTMNVDAAANVKLNKTSVTLSVGKSTTLKVTGTKKKVKWSSSKKSVATVSNRGKVKAIKKGTATITAKVSKKKYNCKVLVYDANSGSSRVNKKVRSIISKNIKANMSTAEKVKAIHDYLVLNCEYDYTNYLNGTIPAVSFTAEGAIVKKRAVCQGYAEAFCVFMDALNIPCNMVVGTGNGGGHAWNQVKIDGKWYHVDVTWDDPVPDRKGYVRYAYFLIPDSKMDDDHWWQKSQYKRCKTSCDKFIKLFGKVSKNADDAAEIVYNGYKSKKDSVRIIIPKSKSKNYYTFMNEVINSLCNKYDVYFVVNTYSYTEYGKYYIYTVFLQ